MQAPILPLAGRGFNLRGSVYRGYAVSYEMLSAARARSAPLTLWQILAVYRLA